MDTQSLAQQLVRDWQKPIYNFALRWFGDENHAADATQETFLVALRDLHQLRSPSKLRSWIFTVARRVMIRQGQRSSPGTLLAEVPSNDGQQSEQAMEKERQERISAELAALPEELRTVLILHYFHDLSQVEMAEQLAIPRTTIQSQLKRGLERLRTKLVACGISYGVLELEQRFRSSPFAAVPDSLKAKLGSLAAPTAVSVSALAAGGLIVKVKMMAVGALTVGLGLGSWFLLADEPNRDISETRTEDRSIELLALQEENDALRKRLKLVEIDRRKGSGPAKSTENGLSKAPDLSELQQKLKSAEAQNSKLMKQVASLKAQLPDDSAPALVARYVTLMEQSIEEMKGLKGAARQEKQDKLSQEMMPIIIKLMSKSGEVPGAILDALSDPTIKDKSQLTTLLTTLFMTNKPNAKERDQFNKRVLDMVEDPTVDSVIKKSLIGQLQLQQKSEGRDLIAERLLNMAQDRNHPLREDALTQLATLPSESSQRFVRNLIEDRSEDPGLRSLAFIDSRAYEKAGGEALTLNLMKESHKDLRRVAFGYASSINQPSEQVRGALEDALQNEKEEDLFENILSSLEDLGNRDSLPKLQLLINDANRSLELRSRAQQTHASILKRLEEKK